MGSQIFFLDKSFENCQKFSGDHPLVSHSKNVKIPKSHILYILDDFTLIICIYIYMLSDLRLSVFWY